MWGWDPLGYHFLFVHILLTGLELTTEEYVVICTRIIKSTVAFLVWMPLLQLGFPGAYSILYDIIL